jgi:hypothetical protein
MTRDPSVDDAAIDEVTEGPALGQPLEMPLPSLRL